jgi:antibiotic biosynthesis monooxygenase (ABM) superfamily enzyme
MAEAFPWDTAPTYLVRDNDRAYGQAFQGRIRAMGIRDRPISPRSPWQNPVLPSPVSVVISTRIKPGQESAYRAWEQRIAAAQAKAPGFQGYRFDPPVPGVQDDWLAILRFDTEANLQAWLDSPERQKLLQDANPFTEEFHARIARTGFDQWFPVPVGGAPPPAAWKMNMLVLLMLYPLVFLFGFFVQTPFLIGRAGLPFAIALFIGNIVSVVLLSYLVPWVAERFSWWLQPAGPNSRQLELAGTALVVALYSLMVLAFWRMF